MKQAQEIKAKISSTEYQLSKSLTVQKLLATQIVIFNLCFRTWGLFTREKNLSQLVWPQLSLAN